MLFAFALMAMLLPTSVLAAGQPLLTGQSLFYSNAKAGQTPPPYLPTWVGSLDMQSTCNPDNTGDFSSLVASGNSNDPYPGTFVAGGNGSMSDGSVTSLALDFEIHDLANPALVVASGTVALDPAAPTPFGDCHSEQDGLDTYTIWDASGWASYSASVNVGGVLTPETGVAAFDVECITLNSDPACDLSETFGIGFYGATIPRNASGYDGTAQTAATATASDPIATSVVGPAGDTVYINESSAQPVATDAYVFLGRQVRVSVYTPDGDEALGTADAPITLTFMVDASLLQGLDPQTITVVRDGVPAQDCPSPASTGLTDAESFCVLRPSAVDADGDLTLVILSLHASTWSVVAPRTLPQYTFTGFSKPVANPGVNGAVNVVKAGQAVPLGWRLTDAAGAPVLDLASAQVSVAGFDCGLSSSADLAAERATGKSGLQNLGNGYYQFNWKTPKSYANSCKTLTLTLSVNGRTIARTALFQFKK